MERLRWMLVVIVGLVISAAAPRWARADTNIENGYALEDIPATEHVTFPPSPTVVQSRKLIDIPQDYGKVLSIYPDPRGGVIVWLESGDGKIHNVYVKWAAEPIVIQRRGRVQ